MTSQRLSPINLSVKEYQLLLLTIERKGFILLIMIQLGCPEFSVQTIQGSNLTESILFLFEWFGHPITAAIYQIGYNNKPDQKPKVIRPRLVSACLSLAVQSESNLKPKQSKTI